MWTGEAWGVRSFADAPEVERTRIIKALKAQHSRDGWRDIYDVGLSDNDVSGYINGNNELTGLPDNWPEWGECVLTEFSDDVTESLARAIDGSEYRAVLRCHAKFGCVQFAANA